MEFLRAIAWKRLFLWWAIMYVTLFVMGFILSYTALDTLVLLFVTVMGPVGYGVFGYLYFRGVPYSTWEPRLFSTAVWLALSLLVSVVLNLLLNGPASVTLDSVIDPTGLALNAAFMVFAGMVAARNTKPPLPEGLEM